MNLKKITAAISALAMAAGIAAYLPTDSISSTASTAYAAEKYNYAEALQKSMFFYEVQQSGKLPDWNEVQWRADSMVDEDGNETDKVPGGWFDAGDHFKFTLTNAYAASVLAWGYIEYKDNVDKAGLGELYRNNLQWGLDYVMGCDLGDGKLVGTIGDFTGSSTDHNIWCSAEVYLRKHHLNGGDWERPYDTIENSTVAALAAAALAEGYIIFKDDQPEKAEQYLEHAKNLFELADTWRSTKDVGGMGSMYPTSTWVDDCMYAADWLYLATNDKGYLDKIESDYIPNFPTENQSSDKKYTWGFCWDDTTQGAALLYAQITGDQSWIDHISHHLDYWIDGYGGKKIDYTPDGLAYLTNWGSLRHASNTAWLAFLSSDTIFKDDTALATKYRDWAKSQMDYAFGDNALGMSYVLGMGDTQPTAFHHRTASGIHDDHWNELGHESSSEGWQTEYAHTLYGALVGGPDSQGKYENEVGKYEFSEVAIDYNAGFTAALCSMIGEYGGEKLDNFPPVETPKWAEWEVAAVLNGSGNSYTEVKAWAMNHTAWPARVAKNISYRYYFDVSEVLEAGLSVDDITVKSNSQQYQQGQQGYATVSGPIKYEGDPSGNTYYAEIKFEDGRAIQPTGQSEHRDEVQFRISIPDAVDGKPTTGAWDPTNDWSYETLTATQDIKSDDAINEKITMYVDDKLVWGVEPDGTEPDTDPTTTTTQPTTGDDIVWGDANCDGKVDISDAVMILQAIANNDVYGVNGSSDTRITEQGVINADVYDNGTGMTTLDALTIQRYLVELIDKLPVTSN